MRNMAFESIKNFNYGPIRKPTMSFFNANNPAQKWKTVRNVSFNQFAFFYQILSNEIWLSLSNRIVSFFFCVSRNANPTTWIKIYCQRKISMGYVIEDKLWFSASELWFDWDRSLVYVVNCNQQKYTIIFYVENSCHLSLCYHYQILIKYRHWQRSR